MKTEMIVAIIGAGAVILSAIIGLFAHERHKNKSIKIKQNVTGKNNIVIALQENKTEEHNNGKE